MTTCQIVIPYLVHPWALEDCIESFGASSVPVLIIDNSPGEDTRQLTFPANVEIEYPGRNLAIAGSWNRGLARGADQTIICSQWVRLAPAEFPRREPGLWGLDYIYEGTVKHSTPYGCTYAEQGFHFISVGKDLVDAIGLFDECFLYGEDDDMRHRMDLADLGGSMGCWADPGVFSIGYGIAKRTVGAIPPQSIDIGAYWRLKWATEGGGHGGGHTTPFGNPDNPLSFWEPLRRA